MTIKRNNRDYKLVKYLQDELDTQAEMTDVEMWIARSEKNRVHYEQVKKIWEEKRFIEPLKAIDVDRLREGLQKKIDESQSAPGNIQVFKRSKVLYWRVAAVVLLLVLSATIAMLLKFIPINPVQQVSSLGEITEVVLSDGSIVELNRGSTLRYPEQLKRRRRKVTLQGEAFFEVTSHKNAAFFVYVGEATVKVLGTSFNLKEVEGEITLSVISGEVLFFESGKEESAIQLTAGERAIFNISDGAFNRSSLESTNFLFWKTAKLTFIDEPLENVFIDLEEYFNTIIVVADEEILKDRVTTSCEGQQLQEILHELSFLHNLQYATRNDTIYVNKKLK